MSDQRWSGSSNAVVAAQSASLDVEEISHITGLSRAQVEAVLDDPI